MQDGSKFTVFELQMMDLFECLNGDIRQVNSTIKENFIHDYAAFSVEHRGAVIFLDGFRHHLSLLLGELSCGKWHESASVCIRYIDHVLAAVDAMFDSEVEHGVNPGDGHAAAEGPVERKSGNIFHAANVASSRVSVDVEKWEDTFRCMMNKAHGFEGDVMEINKIFNQHYKEFLSLHLKRDIDTQIHMAIIYKICSLVNECKRKIQDALLDDDIVSFDPEDMFLESRS